MRELPAGAALLGPVTCHRSAAARGGATSRGIRMLVRVPRDQGLALAAALRRATGVPAPAAIMSRFACKSTRCT